MERKVGKCPVAKWIWKRNLPLVSIVSSDPYSAMEAAFLDEVVSSIGGAPSEAAD
jgi:hypothetical protein